MRNGGLKLALRDMDQDKLNLGVFQDTKVTYGIHTRMLAGYCVFETDAPIRHRGGVEIFYRYPPHFQSEALNQHRTNVFIFQLASGGIMR